MIPGLPSHPNPATAFEQQCNTLILTPGTSALLKECAGLKEFLPRAIEFLTRNNNENQQCAENIAHYLIGDVDYLPEGLAAPASEIPVTVKTELRHCFDEKAAPEKAIGNLTALSTRLYEHQLQEWLNAAPAEKERAARQKAINAILMAINSNSKELSLADLGLTTIPPLPSDLRSLDLSDNRLTSLAGMPQQMNALRELELGHNQLTSLAGMPQQMNALEKLEIGYNQLTSLVGLPQQMNALRVLDICSNRLTSLTGMPQQMNALHKLQLVLNPLTSLVGLPQQMNALRELNLLFNQLTSLAGLPQQMNALEVLNLEDNQLTSLAGISQQMNALKTLNLYKNQLTSLAGLPQQMNALEVLNLQDNQLTSLAGIPQQMNALGKLDLGHNRLTSLAGLPQQMNALEVVLNLEGNQLTSLSEIPQQIIQRHTTAIFLTPNPLSPDTIAAITNNFYQAEIHFDMAAHDTGSRPVKPLDEEVKAWFPGMDTEPWKAYAGSAKGKALATLLMRLHGCASFDGAGRQDSIGELDAILQRMLKDETFRAYCLTAAQGSDANCHDNVQAIFDELRMQLANPATKDGATLGQVVEFQKGRLAARLIDKYVTTLDAGGDPLESGMLLKKELTQELALPIPFKEIKYGGAGAVSNDIDLHKARARDYVAAKLTPEQLAKEMAADPTCAGLLKKSYQITFAAHNLLWQDALEKAEKGTVQGIDNTVPNLEAARKMVFGDGKQHMASQQQEEQALLKKVALHAQANLMMSADERAHWEVEELAQQPDWGTYLNPPSETEGPQQDPVVQTRDVLRNEAGIQFDSKPDK